MIIDGFLSLFHFSVYLSDDNRSMSSSMPPLAEINVSTQSIDVSRRPDDLDKSTEDEINDFTSQDELVKPSKILVQPLHADDLLYESNNFDPSAGLFCSIRSLQRFIHRVCRVCFCFYFWNINKCKWDVNIHLNTFIFCSCWYSRVSIDDAIFGLLSANKKKNIIIDEKDQWQRMPINCRKTIQTQNGSSSKWKWKKRNRNNYYVNTKNIIYFIYFFGFSFPLDTI